MSAIGPGDFVECVDVGGWGDFVWDHGEAPTLGAIYTVRSVITDHMGGDALLLNELERTPRAKAFWGGEIGYAPWRFRPIYRPKSSLIEQLKRPVSEPA